MPTIDLRKWPTVDVILSCPACDAEYIVEEVTFGEQVKEMDPCTECGEIVTYHVCLNASFGTACAFPDDE